MPRQEIDFTDPLPSGATKINANFTEIYADVAGKAEVGHDHDGDYMPADKLQFWDDFNRANTAAGVISNAPNGFVYDVRGASSYTQYAQILNGYVTNYTSGDVYYFGGQVLPENCRNAGFKWKWRVTGSGGQSDYAVILIKPDNAWLDGFLHIVVTPFNATIQVCDSGGVPALHDLVTGVSLVTFEENLPYDVEHSADVRIVGNQIRLTLSNGVVVEGEDPEVSVVAGRYVYWEGYAGVTDKVEFTEIWANDDRGAGNVPGKNVQPYSENLSDLAFGMFPASLTPRDLSSVSVSWYSRQYEARLNTAGQSCFLRGMAAMNAGTGSVLLTPRFATFWKLDVHTGGQAFGVGNATVEGNYTYAHTPLMGGRMALGADNGDRLSLIYTYSAPITAAAGATIVHNATGHTYVVDKAVTASTTVSVRSIIPGNHPTTSDASITINGGAPVTTAWVSRNPASGAPIFAMTSAGLTCFHVNFGLQNEIQYEAHWF